MLWDWGEAWLSNCLSALCLSGLFVVRYSVNLVAFIRCVSNFVICVDSVNGDERGRKECVGLNCSVSSLSAVCNLCVSVTVDIELCTYPWGCTVWQSTFCVSTVDCGVWTGVVKVVCQRNYLLSFEIGMSRYGWYSCFKRVINLWHCVQVKHMQWYHFVIAKHLSFSPSFVHIKYK